ncbi:MAG: hypothetical protein ABI229_04250 [Gemmatimonadaceae bacterium]
MFGLPGCNLLFSLREAARELEAAARWIGAQARSMIVILDTEGGHVGAEIMRQHGMRNADTRGAQDGTHDANSSLDSAWLSLRGGAGDPQMRSAKELRADEGFRAALTQNRASWAFEVSFASDRIYNAHVTLRELAHHYRLETEALAMRISGICDSASGEPGDPAYSMEHRVVNNMAETLNWMAARLSNPLNISLVPDPFEIERDTVWNLWEQVAGICVEYECHAAVLMDVGRALHTMTFISDDPQDADVHDED